MRKIKTISVDTDLDNFFGYIEKKSINRSKYISNLVKESPEYREAVRKKFGF